MVTKELLTAIDNGLGNGETAIFPISIFILKSGVNYNPDDPNYDLFKYSMQVSAKRLFPNYVNQDATFNLPYYDPNDYRTHIASMGCRTRTMGNINGPSHSTDRGNFDFSTINLPYLALMAKEKNKNIIEEFFNLFDYYIDNCIKYLEWRYEIIAKKRVYNFSFLFGQKIYMGSENLKNDDEIRESLKHSTLSVGFVGLSECLVVLIGKHHGESKEAQKLGLKIIKHLKEKMDIHKEETHMNWSAFSTPAESYAGTALRATRKKFGIIPGVTDKDYFTNSFHVTPGYKIKAIDKIKIEAPYHELTEAGHISYIEMDGDPLQNLEAFEKLVRAMHDNNMGYFSINHSVDYDPICGYTGIIANECPHCHRREDGKYKAKIKKYNNND